MLHSSLCTVGEGGGGGADRRLLVNWGGGGNYVYVRTTICVGFETATSSGRSVQIGSK